MKRCCRCRQWKAVSEFPRDAQRKDGLSQRCRPCKNAVNLESYRRHTAKAKQRMVTWSKTHAEQRRAIQHAYAKRHPARVRQQARDSAKRRYHANIVTARMKGREKTNARRAGTERERVDYNRIKRRDKMRCHICRRQVQASELHFDHVIPLSKGGTHTENNIAVSHARCNLSKNARVLTLF